VLVNNKYQHGSLVHIYTGVLGTSSGSDLTTDKNDALWNPIQSTD